MSHGRSLPLCLRAAALACALVVAAPHGARAQLTEATLKGTVVDGTGAGVPAFIVTATHVASGQSRVHVTDERGAFLLAGLAPGVYRVRAESGGFQPIVQEGLRLTVSHTTEVMIHLAVLALSETVSVTGSALTVASAREGRLADSFDASEIRDLPLPQRDIFLLPKLSAGATVIPGAANSTKLASSPVVTVNGNRYRGNNYVLDGSMNTNPNNTGEPAIVPSVEAVEEVQVQTLNFASEFGRANGSTTSTASRATCWTAARTA